MAYEWPDGRWSLATGPDCLLPFESARSVAMQYPSPVARRSPQSHDFQAQRAVTFGISHSPHRQQLSSRHVASSHSIDSLIGKSD